jgi:hypothetical protein
MNAKRFLVVLVLLAVGLTSLITGINLTLDRLMKSPVQSSFVVYDPQGQALYSYNGNLAEFNSSARPATSLTLPSDIPHRT